MEEATVHGLVEAVRSGDVQRVHTLLSARPELVNMDMAENDEHRAVHYAVFARSQKMVRVLMEHGADARKGIYPHRSATSAHTVAVERGYDEIVAIIVAEEAKRRGTEGTSPDDLTEALADGDEDRALAMLEDDAELARARNRYEYGMLHMAAAVGSGRVAAWLLAQGVDVNSRGPRGMTPLDHAAAAGPGGKDVAILLRERGAEMTAMGAVALGDLDWLRKRHAAGSLENPPKGLLAIAVQNEQPEVLKMLLEFGLDPNERVRLEGIEETVYSMGQPLWNCADTGQYAMAELLLERGALPNVHVYASGSPVYRAFHRRDARMVELLKHYGGIVDPVSIGLFGEREMARQMLADEAAGAVLPVGILEGRNVSEDLLRGSADSGDAEIVRMSLPGVDWGREDDRWYWILLQAVWSGSAECLRLVVERCDPNLRHPRFARTILHDVAGLGGEKTAEQSGELAKVLLDAGARMDERDGVLLSTPLGWSCRWRRMGMVRVLLERGADAMEEDAEPWARPMAWAERRGHGEIVELLRAFR